MDAKAARGTYIEDPNIVFDANSDINPLIDVTSAIEATVTDIKVDGAIIDKSNYVINASGDVNIYYDYLIQLAPGDHNFELVMSKANNPTGTIKIPDTCKLEFIMNPSVGGTVELNTTEEPYKEFGTIYYAPKGEETSFYARPSSGYSFSSYSYDGEYGYFQDHTFIPTEDMKITVSFSKNFYKVETDVNACDFGKVKIGYSDVKEQVVKLTNMGNAPFLLEKPELKNYEVEFRTIDGELPDPFNGVNPDDIHGYFMRPEDSVNLIIRPKAGLEAGKYNEDMSIITMQDYSEGIIDALEVTHFSIPLSFEVYDDKAPVVDNKNNSDVNPTELDAKVEPAAEKPVVKTVNSVLPKTGDSGNVVLYAALTAVALLAVVVMVMKRKKK